MKKIICVLLLSSIAFTACSSDNDENGIIPDKKLELSADKSTLNESKTFELIDVANALGTLIVQVSDPYIARAEVTADNKIVVVGIKTGNTVVEVIDTYEGNSAQLDVSVSGLDRETKQEFIYVKKGESREFNFPYSENLGYEQLWMQDDGDILNVSSSVDGKLRVTGTKLGIKRMDVKKNYWYDCAYTFVVVDVYPLEVPSSEFSVYPRPLEFGGAITRGNGGYEVESSDTSIVTASIADFNQEKENNYYVNPANLVIKTSGKPGNAVLTITDAAGQEATVKIEVRETN